MKKIFYIFLILIIVAGFGYFFSTKEQKEIKPEETNKKYYNVNTGISFSYPKIFTANTVEGKVTLHHDIPYQNSGACDMAEEGNAYDKLTDFEMTVEIMNKNLTDTVKTLSPYIPQENFMNNELIPSPGFIDTYNVGGLSGFAIYEGAEGCGQTTYYFPISKDKTLIVTNASIQALSGVRSPDKINEILAVPGAISKEENTRFFEEILKSLKTN